MSKTQVTLTVDADTKRDFQILAKKLGSNMSTLTNMYYKHVINTGRVEYEVDNEPVEFGFIPWKELSESDKQMHDKIQKADFDSFVNL
ncbi:type II toxin-antitoxin system RelB/DinJ family antitoxin [Candidatus Gracilibacteria bacterium]|nr:type II toxin-antitoxin system RelB/DinJ family antitoxin [Candidatus Gracilibacteria bacterium]